jgi:hypothetical protein
MKKYFLLIIALPILTLGGIFAYEKVQYGAVIPVSTAFFETSLANSITNTVTSMTLVSATTKDGTSLSGFYAFVIDEGLSSEEMVNATCASTACTGMTRGLSAINGTSTVAALRQAHRRGASVKITDAPQLLILSRIMNGDESVPNALHYETEPTWVYGLKQLVNWEQVKDYADGLAFGVGVLADTITAGYVEIAGDTEYAGTGSTGATLVVPASSASTTPTANKLARALGTGYLAQGWINLDETFTWLKAHIFQALVTFNGGLTSTATTTLSGSNYLSDAIKINTVPYQFPSSGIASSTAWAFDAQGRATYWGLAKTTGAVSTTTPLGPQVIAHGLGYTPKLVKITARWASGGTVTFERSESTGIWNKGSYSTVYDYSAVITNGAGSSGVKTDRIVYLFKDGTDGDSSATLTVDGTNITLTWTTATAAMPTASFIWEAE